MTDASLTTINIGFDANGITDYATFATLQEPVYVNIWYDQTGIDRHFTGVAGTAGTNGTKPRLIFTEIGDHRIPSILFSNSAFVSTVTCTELGLDNESHATMLSMKSSMTNTEVMFLTSGKKSTGTSTQFEGNEIHTNGSGGSGARVINGTSSTPFVDFGTRGQFTDSGMSSWLAPRAEQQQDEATPFRPLHGLRIEVLEQMCIN